tara:strand:+ start:2573 stop:4396 length:1824 start_codon:yes stop_codon:yes gene_type:complete
MKFDFYKHRSVPIILIISICFLFIVIKLFAIQIVNTSYKLSAQNNVIRKIIKFPERGWMYDRNGKLLVSNQIAHDLMIVPYELQADFDTLEFCKLINTSLIEFEKKIKKAKRYSHYKSSIFISAINKEDFARIQESLHFYKGFFVQPRYIRHYNYNSAGNVFGYVGEITGSLLDKNPDYKKGDMIGRTGVEQVYEKYLKGEKGVERKIVDVFGRSQGQFEEGKYDTLATAGEDVTLTIDIELQEYGEKLMQNKRGSIVAIEPNTGEIICLISSPTYDPSLLVGKNRNETFYRLYIDPSKPLFDRSISAVYPPGSVFKLVNALIGLEEEVIHPGTLFNCSNGWNYKNILNIGCHSHKSPLNLRQAIAQSCNAYFCSTFDKIVKAKPSYSKGLSNWEKHTKTFGMGDFLNNDLYDGRTGKVPNSKYYDRLYGKKRWGPSTCISLGIGQDALLITPIQMANLGALIANKGYYKTPHIVKLINNNKPIDSVFFKKKYSSIQTKHFDPVIYGMQTAIEGDFGTAKLGKVDNITICGKTGTAQNPSGDDHSIFMGFAPKKNPKIAIAVYIENGGWGSDVAVPIGSLCIEKYLNKEIHRKELEKKMINKYIVYK